MSWKQPFFEREEILSIIAVLLIIISTTMIFIPYNTIYTIEYPIKLTVESGAEDVSSNQDILDFGMLNQGLRVKKHIKIAKEKAQSALVYVNIKGDIKPLIDLSETKFVITEPKDLEITAIIPNDAEEKNYSGVLEVSFKMSIARKIANIFF